MILFFGENNYSYGISSEGYYNYITYALWVSYNIKDLQLLFFLLQNFTASFRQHKIGDFVKRFSIQIQSISSLLKTAPNE